MIAKIDAKEKVELLHIEKICLSPGKDLITQNIYEGEIVGLAGLEGHGQQEFLKGHVVVNIDDTHTLTITNFYEAAKAGIVYLPKERKTEGILPTLSVFDNFAISLLSRESVIRFINKNHLKKLFNNYKTRLSITLNSQSSTITNLSGGNQQKVLIARLLATSPRVMLLDDPTRGVDYETKKILYEIFKELANMGKTTLVLLSTEIEEFIQLCDRTLVFYNKELFTEIPKAMISKTKIVNAMFGRRNENDGS